MSWRRGNENWLAAHYDWLALAVGVITLIGGAVFYMTSAGEDEDMDDSAVQVHLMKPSETGVVPLDMSELQAATAVIRKPAQLADIPEQAESFLASERRVLCSCGKAIPGDPKAVPVCPYCGAKQEEAKKVALDSDGDGLPDEWEWKYGLDANDASNAAADPDGDEFTNLEEFAAKTDPTDPKSHPDYLDFLKVVLPLKETSMPFVFRKANKIPAGWRCEFFDPVRKDDYGRKGATLTALVGEEIADTGFVLKSHSAKTARQAIKGSELTKTVDASEVVVERKGDGKRIKLVVQQGKGFKLAPVDVQATLSYSHGTGRTFDVIPGSEITIGNQGYRISDIKASGKGARVVVKRLPSGPVRTLEALEL